MMPLGTNWSFSSTRLFCQVRSSGAFMRWVHSVSHLCLEFSDSSHFAHADLMTSGAFFALIFASLLSGMGPIAGLPTGFVVLPLAAVATALLAIGLDRMFYRPLRARNVKPLLLLVASLGVALMLQGITRLFAGTSIRSFFTTEKKDIFRIEIPFDLATRDIVITEPQVLLIVTTIVSIFCLHQFLKRSRLGKAMRAMADNADLALVSGINTDTVVRATWIIAGALAAAGGLLLGLDVSLKPDLSFNILLPIFAGCNRRWYRSSIRCNRRWTAGRLFGSTRCVQLVDSVPAICRVHAGMDRNTCPTEHSTDRVQNSSFRL